MEMEASKPVLINGIPAQVRKQVWIRCKGTQKYREEVCKQAHIAEHSCEGCSFLKIEW